VRLDGTFVGRADFGWPAHRLLVEIDGYEFHKEYGMFVQDRKRWRRRQIGRWWTLHFAASEVENEPESVVAEVRAGLALAG
jgi:very-short-patch-repair endonuclease